jgi:hypothetical protein
MGNGARSNHRPELLVGTDQRPEAFPRALRTGLAAGVVELDARHRTDILNHARDGLERLQMCVVPQAEVAPAAHAPKFDLGRLGKHQTRAPRGKRSQVRHVEGRRAPFVGAIERHRRDNDPVAQGDVAEGRWAEEQAHSNGLFSARLVVVNSISK